MKIVLFIVATLFTALQAFAQAKVMNPGEAYGQLVILSAEDITAQTAKYKSLNPLSIPVFGELPMDMSVVAGAMTLKQQTLLSHIQIKSRGRKTPNLDISALEGGLANPLFEKFQDGAWIHMVLGADNSISIQASTEEEALKFYNSKKVEKVELSADLSTQTIFRSEDMGYQDSIRVGAKAANYAELAKALNTAERTVVRPGFGIPFYYYQEFIENNPKIKAAISSVLRDPLMNKVAKTSYREAKLTALQQMMVSEEALVSDKLVDDLLAKFEQIRDGKNLPRKMKLRSSTNSEDLGNFNGAGLYTSDGYNPINKKGVEKTLEKKRETLKETLRTVWASVWNLRAYDERSYFRIPHGDVKMGIQVNISFKNEDADGVVVTKNVPADPRCQGQCIYIEVQRGNEYSVANPVSNVKPQKILVQVDPAQPLETSAYKVIVLQNSNVGDDTTTILPNDNPNPVINQNEILDLAYQCMRAQTHFKPLLGPNKDDFALDIEFKVDREDTEARQIYLKQARPYID